MNQKTMDASLNPRTQMVKNILMYNDQENSKELIHYAEKPESSIGNLINCGIYIFTSDLFKQLKEAKEHKLEVDLKLFFYSFLSS